jgi:hypothetical protein
MEMELYVLGDCVSLFASKPVKIKYNEDGLIVRSFEDLEAYGLTDENRRAIEDYLRDAWPIAWSDSSDEFREKLRDGTPRP